jgi:hypothetical protein
VSSPVIPWQRLLTLEILKLHELKSFLHRLKYKTDLVAPVVFKITPRCGPRRNSPFPTVRLLLRVDSLLRELVYRAVALKRLWDISLSRGRRMVTALHATIRKGYLALVSQNVQQRAALKRCRKSFGTKTWKQSSFGMLNSSRLERLVYIFNNIHKA